MNITIIGSGYVGLVSGICFARLGHNVTCIDNQEEKIHTLNKGEIPIFEPGLKEMLADARSNNLISFSSDLSAHIANCDAVFIAVGTPQDEDGSADLSYVLTAAQEINDLCLDLNKKDLILVTKSTVPVGTAEKIKKITKNSGLKIASNPEFLREGNAIEDFMKPDRVVIGCDDELSSEALRKIYSPLTEVRIVETDTKTSELIKYTSNALLATKIAFINEIANLCEKTGANIKELSKATGLDSRIGEKFLNVGPGYGGSCFPKDVNALIRTGKDNEVNLSIIDAVESSNVNRKKSMAHRIISQLGGLDQAKGKVVAILGLAFKANTDDIRYSPAIATTKELVKHGIAIRASDFEAIKNSKRELANEDGINYFVDPYKAIENTDLVAILTEWPQYSELDIARIKESMRGNIICDLRNMLNKQEVESYQLQYDYIGKYQNND